MMMMMMTPPPTNLSGGVGMFGMSKVGLRNQL